METVDAVKAVARNKWNRDKTTPLDIRFICLGNICRSPAAEAIFKAAIDERCLNDYYSVDSCGTGSGYPNWYKNENYKHLPSGDQADKRMRETAKQHGISIATSSRPLNQQDVLTADLLLGMDSANMEAIKDASTYWNISHISSTKTFKLSDFCLSPSIKSIPDPYFGGYEGFEYSFNLLKTAINQLIDSLEEVNTKE